MVILGPSNYYFKQPSHSIYSTPVLLQCKQKLWPINFNSILPQLLLPCSVHIQATRALSYVIADFKKKKTCICKVSFSLEFYLLSRSNIQFY